MSKLKRLITSVLFLIIITSCSGPGEETFADQEPVTSDPSIEQESPVDEGGSDSELIDEKTNESPEEKEDSEEDITGEERPVDIPKEFLDDTEETDKAEQEEIEEIEYNHVDDFKYARGAVNVRQGPSTVYDIIGKLSKGQKVNRIGTTHNGWAVIDYNGSDGFVSASYLLDSKEAKPTARPTAKPTQEPTAKPTKKPEAEETQNFTIDEYAAEVLRLVNIERSKEGLSELTTNESLRNAANIRAIEIKKLFSHDRPDGTSCFTVLDEVGISYRAAGENIAYGQESPEEVVDGWMNSEGHRANILEEMFGKMGVGIHIDQDGHIGWAQLFMD